MAELFIPKCDNVRLANCVVLTSEGAKLRLGQLWQNRPAIFIFLRHFACIACRAHAKEVWDKRELYKDKGNLIFIGNGQPEFIDSFKESLGIKEAFILTDPSLESYRAAGFHLGFFYVVQIPTLVNVWKLTKKGHKQVSYTKKAGTHWQLGGVVVVSTEGKITYQHISESLGDFPEEPHFTEIVSDEKERSKSP